MTRPYRIAADQAHLDLGPGPHPPMLPGRLIVPGMIWIDPEDEEVLRWRWRKDDGEPPATQDASGPILERFANLADAPASRILQFARRYGVLHLTENGDPLSQSPEFRSRTYSGLPASSWIYSYMMSRAMGVRLFGDDEEEMSSFLGGEEPLDAWRERACEIQVTILTYLKSRTELPPRWVWNVLYPEDSTLRGVLSAVRDVFRLEGLPPRSLEGAQKEIGQYIESLANRAEIHPFFSWSEDHERLQPSLEPVTFFDRVLFDLAALLTGTSGLSVCTSCGEVFTPEARRRPAGRNHYCPTCGKTAANRDAQRRRRERKRLETSSD